MNTQAQSRTDAQPSFCKRELAVLRLLAKEQSRDVCTSAEYPRLVSVKVGPL